MIVRLNTGRVSIVALLVRKASLVPLTTCGIKASTRAILHREK
jgi:hypothetical protein